MSPLLDLPPELLNNIIDHVHPDDIINFALCRLGIYRLAKDAVSLHLQRKRIYEEVVLHGCHRHENNAHPLLLMREMCMDWRIGEYVKSFEFQCCHHPNTPDDADEDEEDTKEFEVAKSEDDIIVQTTMQAIQGCIEQKAIESGLSTLKSFEIKEVCSGVVSRHGPLDVEEYCSDIAGGNRGPMLALLLLFTPNLEAICLARCTWGSWHLESVINLAAVQNLQRSPKVRKPLMNLSQVRFVGYDDENDLYADGEGEDFQRFMSFAALPSMRTISGDFVEGRYDAEAGWDFAPHSSNVTEIILQHSVVHAEFLEIQLVGIKALKRFTYDYNENFNDGRMETHKIIGTLLEHAKHSLEYLAFTGRCDLRDKEMDIHPCRGSLRDFEVLKEVLLNSHVFVEHAPSDDPESNSEEISHSGSHGQVVRRLVDMLPPSIEIVQLVGAEVINHASGLLGNLFEQKERRLPKLSKLIIERSRHRPGHGWVIALRERCKNVGVTLKTGWDGY